MKLANYFLIQILGPESDIDRKNFSHEFIEILKTYPWPGNVRELYHALERAVTSSQLFTTLYAQHLPKEIRAISARSNTTNKQSHLSCETKMQPISNQLSKWKNYKNDTEKYYLQELLKEANKSIPEACQISGLSRARVYQLINKYSPDK